MIILPAIDIMNGKCVRLSKGEFASQKIYSEDPIAIARQFEKEGATMLHIVDLDGARCGKPQNDELILRIANAINIPIQVGGGIRSMEAAKKYLEGGAWRIIVGTAAINEESFLTEIFEQFGREKVIVSIDMKNGQIASHGWQEATDEDLDTFLKKLSLFGVRDVIVTDVTRDGTLTAPNYGLMEKIQQASFGVIAAGGVSDEKALQKLSGMGIRGAILGKALYEGRLSLQQAIAATARLLRRTAPRNDISHLTKRIIPCLDIKNGRVVKGTRFESLRDAGDPVMLGKKYSEEGADELIFLDITASKENRGTMVDLVKQVAREVFIPFTVGGGISCVEEIRVLLQAGADKISLNTAAILNPNLISAASEKFGAQCIVVAIDVKKIDDEYRVFIKGGSEPTPWNALEWAKEAEKLGAGEILLTSMDSDGTQQGFDIPLLKKISSAVKIPVIASGGAGSLKDFKEACVQGQADAVLAASLFHYGSLSIQEVKEYLNTFSIPVRL